MESLTELWNNLQNSLSSEHELDVDGQDLFHEILSTHSLFPKTMTAFEALSFIHETQMKEI